MTNAEHILQWAVNSQRHLQRLKGLHPQMFIRENGRAAAAFNLAHSTTHAMVLGGDLGRNDYTASDVLEAAKLMLEWTPDQG